MIIGWDAKRRCSPEEDFKAKRIALDIKKDAAEAGGSLLSELPRKSGFEYSYDPSERPSYRENARITGVIDARAASSVFLIGKMAGQSQHSLSDKDRSIFDNEWSKSSSPETRASVMTDTAQKAVANFTPAMLRQMAGNIAGRPPEEVQAFMDSPVVPKAVKDAVRQVQADQLQRQSAPSEQGAGRFAQPNLAPQQSPSQPHAGTPTPSRGAAPSGSSDQGMNTIEKAREQALQVQKQQQEMILGRYELEVKRYELAEQRAKEERDFRARQEARQARLDAERQRDKIAAAFAQLGRAISSSVRGGSVGGSINMGGDQDASAFKIGQRQSRVAPPTPAPARSGFDYVRRSRSAGQ